MEKLRVIGLKKSYGIRDIFDSISFDVERGQRIGLVGPNGVGKSTLLKCILGEEEADGGEVIISEYAKIGYLQQDVNLGDDSLEEEIQKAFRDVQELEEAISSLTTMMEEREPTEKELAQLARYQERLEWLGGYDYERQSKAIAYGLGFSDEDLKKKASEFSGGQKTRINLAKALVRRPDFLLLDEPTNHLDMEMLEWLEVFLSNYKGGLLVVSHDRYFLNRIVTSIIEIEPHKAVLYKGNYSHYVAVKEDRLKAQQIAYEKQQEHIKKTEAYIEKYRAGIKSKMARGRQSQLNRLERIEAPIVGDQLSFSFPTPATCADKVVVADRIELGYGDIPLFEDLSFMIRRGEIIGLIGPNGAGKSTLVKAIVGEKYVTKGFITIGNRVQIGYFSQEHEDLHDDYTIVQEVMERFSFNEDKARKVLGLFLFRGDDVFKKIQTLSGGERARLSLLLLFLEGDNFLVLDEPTNHLDIPTREVVEKALQLFSGTCLVISHDRYFLDAVTKRTWQVHKGQLIDIPGNYSYAKEKIALREEGEEKRTVVEKKKEVPISLPKEESGEKEKEAKKPNTFMREKEIAKVEQEIGRLEATQKMYMMQLNNPMIHEDGEEMSRLAKELAQVEEELNTLYERWAFLSEE